MIVMYIPMELIYTKDIPTEAGWYWRRDKFGQMIVRIRWYAGNLCITNSKIFTEGVEWAGPIPFPGEKNGRKT